MIFRRRKAGRDEPAELDVSEGDLEGQDAALVESEDADELAELDRARPHGPWDRSETTADEQDDSYVDLGGLVVRGHPGLELRLQVNEATESVEAVMLAGAESGLELRAFAAPRSTTIWDDVRHDIAAEAAKRGGTATEVDGEFGTELQVVVPVQTPDGRQATQPSRIVGVEGPRWLLRGTFLGASAQKADPDGEVERAFRDVIVVRGDGPMMPREMIPMRIPNQAVQTPPPGSHRAPDADAE